MSLQDKIFHKIVTHFQSIINKPPLDVGDGYGAEWQLEKRTVTILNDDDIYITFNSDYEVEYDGILHVDSLDDFDVFMEYIESDKIDVILSSRIGNESLDVDFNPNDTQLRHLSKLLK